MRIIYKVVTPAAITGLTLGLILPEERRDTPDQPHVPHGENATVVPSTSVEWGVSGTNVSAGLVSTNWTRRTLLLPFDSNSYVVNRLREGGLTVEVSSADRPRFSASSPTPSG